MPGFVNGMRDYGVACCGQVWQQPLLLLLWVAGSNSSHSSPHRDLLSFPLVSERGGIKWGHGRECLALGFEPIGRIGREVEYLGLVSHNCLELLLGYCKHAVINSWAQCLESLGKGSVQNARKHLRHATVENSLVPCSSSSGAHEGC